MAEVGKERSVKTAMMRVTDIARETPSFRLPDGFRWGEERFMAMDQCFEMHVIGPFPDDLPDYVSGRIPEVKPIITSYYADGKVKLLFWQWTYDGKNIGDPIEMSVA